MPFTQQDYQGFTPITDNALVDVTNSIDSTVVPVSAPGWKLNLVLNGTGIGEKVLGSSTTANNVILFPTYTPAASNADPCKPAGVNRAYALSVDNGRPSLNFNGDSKVDKDDAYQQLNQDGIVDAVNVAVIREPDVPGQPPSTGDPMPKCIAGVEVLKQCVPVGSTVRTYWKRKS